MGVWVTNGFSATQHILDLSSAGNAAFSSLFANAFGTDISMAERRCEWRGRRLDLRRQAGRG